MTSPEPRLEAIFESRQPRNDLTWLLIVFAGLFSGSAYQISQQLLALGAIFTLRAQRWWLVIGLYGLGVLTLSLAAFMRTSLGGRLFVKWVRFPRCVRRLRWLGFGGIIFVIALYPALVLALMSDLLADIFPRLLVYLILTLMGALALRVADARLKLRAAALVAGLLIAFSYQIATFGLSISAYPFSLSWSETSRFYYASLFFAEKVYGMALPPSVLHPTRYLMQSLPFLIDGIPLWGHRLWQVVLWVFFTLGAAWLFARRLRLKNPLVLWMIVFWGYLFLFQGPVYYHLAIPLMIVFAGFDAKKFWRNLLVVVLASVWAGVSRLNWFPVPAMLAAMLYLLEAPQNEIPWWRYLLPPAVWGLVGTVTAFITQAAYVVVSGNDAEKFTSSFSSDLLWYRLWPNETYALGLVLNALLVSLPVLWLLLARRGRQAGIRMLGLLALVLALFAGGLIVSVKIGGGSNLHNLDAYLALWMVLGGYFFFGRFTAETSEVSTKKSALEITSVRLWKSATWPLLLSLVVVPVLLTLKSGAPFDLPASNVVNASLDAVHQQINYAARDGGEVLLISQRHLLYFDEQIDLPLVSKYEKVFFMEMVMSRNADYLNAFYADVQNQRFVAIITDQVLENYKDPTEEAWVEEHNLWVQLVSRPLLCYYEPRLTLRQVHLQILYPRSNVDNCPALDEARQILP
ncbi:MAG: hypothetical protein HN413_17335 [Chloroflexi bacterium]|jgi:hypothetical protein|nr:hypothetical protein [Chloroflexota bacterium]